MVKKKLSGQTIVIIILAAVLLITVAFGGVYAFYSANSNKISGKIIMANLTIGLLAENNIDSSVIVISNGTNCVPGQELKNSPLKIENYSTAPIYLVLVYEINSLKVDDEGNPVKDEKGEEIPVVDQKEDPVLDVGYPYLNPNKNISYVGEDEDWVDYLYTSEKTGEQYRCFVSMVKYDKGNEDVETITVIGKDDLKFSRYVGNEYKSTSISFKFQAYAIGSESFGRDISEDPVADKCKTIVDAIYESENDQFLQT